MPDEDWKKQIREADKAAQKKADEAADPQLADINKQVAELQSNFEKLKLADQATYDKLVSIVESATQRNESIAAVVTRIKALGGAAAGLATTIGNIASGGGLADGAAALRDLLKG